MEREQNGERTKKCSHFYRVSKINYQSEVYILKNLQYFVIAYITEIDLFEHYSTQQDINGRIGADTLAT